MTESSSGGFLDMMIRLGITESVIGTLTNVSHSLKGVDRRWGGSFRRYVTAICRSTFFVARAGADNRA